MLSSYISKTFLSILAVPNKTDFCTIPTLSLIPRSSPINAAEFWFVISFIRDTLNFRLHNHRYIYWDTILDDCQPRLKSASSAHKTWLYLNECHPSVSWSQIFFSLLLLLLLLLLLCRFVAFAQVVVNAEIFLLSELQLVGKVQEDAFTLHL